jgi:hypothetical protein
VKGEAKLVYVVEKAGLKHVSKYAGLSLGERPFVTCPECKGQVILRLGQKNVHHAAHKADSFCILTKPETVLHFNTKTFLHSQLVQASELYVSQKCVGWEAPEIGNYKGGHRDCHRERPHLWLEKWDQVETERFIESRKPDIIFYKEGNPIAAIEVFATHAVDEQKRDDLEQFRIPWLEVKADEELYSEEYGWNPKEPLPFIVCAPALPKWTCERCLQAPEQYIIRTAKIIENEKERLYREWKQRAVERAAEQARREQERRSREVLMSDIHQYANIIFTYRDDGTRSTHLFYITYKKAKGVTEEITLQYGPDFEVLAHVSLPNISRQVIRDSFNAYIAKFKNNCVHIVSATNWMPLESVATFMEKWESPYVWDSDEWVKRGIIDRSV